MIYLQKDTANKYVRLDFQLGENYNIGTTYEDYLSGSWILLSADQEEFYNENPTASVKEVLQMQIDVYVPTLEEVRANKIRSIETYDSSDSVNSFSFAGQQMWLDKSTRVGLMNSINIEMSEGKTETTLWFNGHKFTLPIPHAVQMLKDLEIYALESYNVTQGHIATIKELTTMEEVSNYDYTEGYPDKLSF